MKLEIRGEDPNYLATVVKINEIKKHPNADKLSIVTVLGNDVIVANDCYNVGDVLVYFPIECSISNKLLSWGNLYEDTNLNQNPEVRGYFQTSGRVKAINLRKIPSQGFLFSAEKLAEFLKDKNTLKVGDVFDTINGERILEKYIKPENKVKNNQVSSKKKIPTWLTSSVNYFPRPIRKGVLSLARFIYNVNDKNSKIISRIVDGQFGFHYSTPQLGNSVYALSPDDIVTISAKIHGTSAVFGKLLWKKKYYDFYKFLNKFGIKIDPYEYKFTYSSRSILKNRRDGKYTDDVWGIHAEELEKSDAVDPGYTLYGEILGWVGPNKCIQKDYDYGVHRGKSEFWVYRITYTDKDGNVQELDWDEIEAYCDEKNILTVPVYWRGRLGDMYDIPEDENFHENLLAKLKEEYLDKTCELCTTGVVREGIVLKVNNKPNKPVYKFKSPLFNVRESSARDKGEEDTEENS